MSSAGLYTTSNVFAQVIYASAELFLGGLQSLIHRINPIVQTGPPPISSIFARSIGACTRRNRLHTPFVTMANSAVLVLSSPHLSDLRFSPFLPFQDLHALLALGVHLCLQLVTPRNTFISSRTEPEKVSTTLVSSSKILGTSRVAIAILCHIAGVT